MGETARQQVVFLRSYLGREIARKWAYILISVALLIILSILSPPQGLNTAGLRAIGVLAMAVMLWVTEVLSPVVTGLLIMVLLPLLKVIDFSQSLLGFADSSIWLLIGVFILSAAMVKTGFDRRLAFSLIRLARADARRTIYMVIVTMMILTFIIPTSAGRSALMVPICLGIANAMALKPGSNVAKAMFIAVPYISLVFSSSLMTGALSMVYAVGLFQKVAGYSWNYLSWFVVMFPGALIVSLLVGPILLKIFPPEIKTLHEGASYIEGELKKLGQPSKDEIKIALLFFLMLLLWVTNFLHHLPVALLSLAVAVLVFLPGIELITWKEAAQKIDWGTVVLFGSSLALAGALKESGAVDWLARIAFGWAKGFGPATMATFVLVITALVRFGFNSVLASTTTMLPVVMAAAATLGINPVWLGMITIIGSDLCLCMPTQSPTNLATYATGYYSIGDMFKAGIWVSLALVIVTVALAMFYWPLVGLTP
ncbi:MAG: solute carrier family 13 (sodium-dependent dicarboxylate transporter), er 2/3/5 [Clostridia bacterium]|nr:solute carrier family 13 (sodium-dependent dicarboxylate transporter), er 2/3/5 [Clostridia bacterium]